MKGFLRMGRSLLLSLTLLAAWMLPLFGDAALPVAAASVDYPVQLMNIAAKDNSSVLTAGGTGDGAAVLPKAPGKDLTLSWRFDRVGKDSVGTFFKLVNAASGRLLTPAGYQVSAGTSVILYGSESAKSQHWYVIPVQQDRLGNDLYYKIVNYSDTSLALTRGASGMSLASYTGADNQLFLLNADGLQGFAGYCQDDNTGKVKAADIGGLFGEVVEVSTFADLKKYATADEPYTIVVTADLKVTSLQKDSSGRYYCPDGRIYVHSNKTIIGSYNAHTLYNVQFCTATKHGVGNNIIIKNFDLQHDAESNGNDSIVVYFGSGQNLWVDHCTFTGHAAVNTASTGLEDWDKFLACCYDADYCSVSDSSFGLHEYGLILGYPADDENSYKTYNNFPRMSLLGNRFTNTITRGPGLMRYGYFHSMNNYVNTFSMAYTVHTACKIYAENCYYDGGSIKGNVICDWNSVTYPGSYAESGSKFVNCKRTTIEGQAQNCTWRPNKNYSYVTLSADQAKTYCESYTGCQTSKNNMMYLRYGTKGIPSAGYTESPSAPTAASFPEGAAYRIKNVNSGLYMQVAGGKAENGANVQQWGTGGTSVHDVWKLYSAGDGYYYIVSALGDGASFVLDVAGKKADNGANLDIYQYNGGTNQQFMFTANGSGSYKLRTRISGAASAVEVANGDTGSGANVQQWQINGAACQDWILEEATDPGCKMDVSLIYGFENENSGQMMEIANASMQDGANVQQYPSNGLDCQKWVLTAYGSGNLYYIRSAQDDSFALRAESGENGGNLSIAPFAAKSDAQLFRFVKNLNGSYSILTHASAEACLVETGYASKENGANVQQWENTSNGCQRWLLHTEAKPVRGNVNRDGSLSVADLVLVQRWLTRVPDTTLADWKAADLTGDGILTGADLVLLRQALRAV